MKYNQPYGVSDPNAPYINGNPSTGTMGSIPPAASIEHPQREIANFITDSALTPTDTDLRQLSKAVQSGKVNFSLDTGPQNLIYITATPPLTALFVGLRFIVKMGHPNSAPVKVSVNGLPAVDLLHRDLTPLGAYELLTGSVIDIAYDGTNFQLMSGVSGGLVYMTAPRQFYVNGNTGDDVAFDGTSATVGTAGVGPFRTIKKALTTMTKYNLNGYNFQINVADGNYSDTTILDFPTPNGSGEVAIIGNEANPDAVQYANTGLGTAFRLAFGGNYRVHGFTLRATAPVPGDAGNCIQVANATQCYFGNINFNSCPGYKTLCGPGGTAMLGGNYTVYGGGQGFMMGWYNGIMLCNTPTEPVVTFSVPGINFSVGFAIAVQGAQTRALFAGFAGNVGSVTGARYLASGNGVIETAGRGASYLPGSVPGSLASGGQYV